MKPNLPLFSLLTTAFIAVAAQQTCENYGFTNTSTCACPTGFGGPTCSAIACGGTLFDGPKRRLTPSASDSNGFANLTAAGCACEGGWGGTACNVCQSADACQSAFASTNPSPPAPAPTNVVGGQINDTVVCNTSPRVYTTSQMSCQVNNPTLQAIYPLSSTLNIIRTLNPDLALIPNTTSFGSAGTVYSQIFYSGVEQFFCKADSCSQSSSSSSSSSIDWNCQNLQCTCRKNTTFCGGVQATDLSGAINTLSGNLTISCDAPSSSSSSSTCHFIQSTLVSLFGSQGLILDSCTFGECLRQSVIDTSGPTGGGLPSDTSKPPLNHAVIAGLAVVCALILASLILLLYGVFLQRKLRKASSYDMAGLHVGIDWANVSYTIPGSGARRCFGIGKKDGDGVCTDRVILDNVSGTVPAGHMMAILGPSGAGKTTLVEILAGKSKTGIVTGKVAFPGINGFPSAVAPRIGFVPQQDILPPTLTVFEALHFAACLRLPESVSDAEKRGMVEELLGKLGIMGIRDTRIGYSGGGDGAGGKGRGISGGEMRRVSIGLELIAKPDVLILDEPTSGLDSVSASRIAQVLHEIACDPVNPIPVIASIHQPNSQIYQTFNAILLLSHGRVLYSGPGHFAPSEYFARYGRDVVPVCAAGYNVADYLLEVASDPHVSLFQQLPEQKKSGEGSRSSNLGEGEGEKGGHLDVEEQGQGGEEQRLEKVVMVGEAGRVRMRKRSRYATIFLTQFQMLAGREWKILRRDKTLFFTHVATAVVLGAFCGGLYFHTNLTISGFQSRIGCLFFLGALIAFSSLSALFNVVETRPLFIRERSSMYYSPTAWLLSRFIFDFIPLRLIPTIIVSTMTYWMAGLANDAAHFFKFLLILALYTLVMTLFNFLLGTAFNNGGVAILCSALTALYQMTFAGFFAHTGSIPPVLRWLQWFCPLKFTLEALSVNEVGSGLFIVDKLQGVPVRISAALILELLFGMGLNNYYRDVLVLCGYSVAFGVGVIGVVWWKVRERR